jgi:hypothetical protein
VTTEVFTRKRRGCLLLASPAEGLPFAPIESCDCSTCNQTLNETAALIRNLQRPFALLSWCMTFSRLFLARHECLYVRFRVLMVHAACRSWV